MNKENKNFFQNNSRVVFFNSSSFCFMFLQATSSQLSWSIEMERVTDCERSSEEMLSNIISFTPLDSSTMPSWLCRMDHRLLPCSNRDSSSSCSPSKPAEFANISLSFPRRLFLPSTARESRGDDVLPFRTPRGEGAGPGLSIVYMEVERVMPGEGDGSCSDDDECVSW